MSDKTFKPTLPEVAEYVSGVRDGKYYRGLIEDNRGRAIRKREITLMLYGIMALRSGLSEILDEEKPETYTINTIVDRQRRIARLAGLLAKKSEDLSEILKIKAEIFGADKAPPYQKVEDQNQIGSDKKKDDDLPTVKVSGSRRQGSITVTIENYDENRFGKPYIAILDCEKKDGKMQIARIFKSYDKDFDIREGSRVIRRRWTIESPVDGSVFEARTGAPISDLSQETAGRNNATCWAEFSRDAWALAPIRNPKEAYAKTFKKCKEGK